MDRVSERDRSSRHRDRDRDHKHKHHSDHRKSPPSDRRREERSEREGSRKRKEYEENDDVDEREREKESKRSKEDNKNGDYHKRDRESRRFSDRKESRLRDEGLTENKNGSKADDSAEESNALDPKESVETHQQSKKVPLNTKSNEKEGVRIRSDEIQNGKSSTDDVASNNNNSSNVKSSSLSLDALAKAKKALQLQKELKEKMKKIPLLNKLTPQTTSKPTESKSSPIPPIPQPGITSAIPGITPTIPNLEAVKRAQELAAKMGFRQDPEFAPLINMFPGSNNSVADVAAPHRPGKAPVLRLDAHGREVDEQGNVVSGSKPNNISTLKVNINKQKKDAFQIIKPDFDAIAHQTSHFDPNMGINKNRLLRPKRPGFQFVEEGAMSKMAETQRIKSQFGEAQAKELRVKQAQLAKAKAEPDINPNLIAVAPRVPTKQQKQKDEIPDIEWWDKPLLTSGSYTSPLTKADLNKDKITKYCEHPRPIEPPAEPALPPPQPLKLTKKEQKKLRTQRRLAKEKDRQEMIRQGLLEPPKPKVKMSNLMRVLGAEATQDPTKMEMEVRNAAFEREQAHIDRNIARKLTPAEKREKKKRKLFGDGNSSGETLVSVYKVRYLNDRKTRFKVDVNAKENQLTGCIVISDELTVIVVEGGKKSIERYNKLMLNRIDWASVPTGNDDEETEENEGRVNGCELVWQGSVGKSSFNRFVVCECRSEVAARKVFADAGVPHYWDLAVNFNEEI